MYVIVKYFLIMMLNVYFTQTGIKDTESCSVDTLLSPSSVARIWAVTMDEPRVMSLETVLASKTVLPSHTVLKAFGLAARRLDVPALGLGAIAFNCLRFF